MPDDQAATLQDYSNGRISYRTAIDRLGFQDFADLLAALLEHNLSLPKLSFGAEGVARLVAILQERNKS